MNKLYIIFLVLFAIVFYVTGEDFKGDSCTSCQKGIIVRIDNKKSNNIDIFYNVTVLFDKGKEVKASNNSFSIGDSVLVDTKFSFFKGCGYIVSNWKK